MVVLAGYPYISGWSKSKHPAKTSTKITVLAKHNVEENSPTKVKSGMWKDETARWARSSHLRANGFGAVWP